MTAHVVVIGVVDLVRRRVGSECHCDWEDAALREVVDLFVIEVSEVVSGSPSVNVPHILVTVQVLQSLVNIVEAHGGGHVERSILVDVLHIQRSLVSLGK